MSMDEATVTRLARLAAIRLSADETSQLASDLDRMISWIDQITAIDTTSTEPMVTPFAGELRWRVDEVTEGDMADALMANAPQAAHGFFAVPKVIE